MMDTIAIIPTMQNQIPTRYQEVLTRIEKAALGAGRDPASITLVAVTKTWPAEVVLAAYESGMRDFGENRPEELEAKRAQVEVVLGRDSGIVWHGIGNPQSRKTNLAADNADVFHAIDRLRIARRLSARAQQTGRSLQVMIEVNVSGERSKAGFDASNWSVSPTQRQALLAAVQEVHDLSGLDLVGLMMMAPWEASEPEIRQLFARTRELGLWLQEQLPATRLPCLSMGMTNDFEIAIAEGATHVRVGRAIFGSRG